MLVEPQRQLEGTLLNIHGLDNGRFRPGQSISNFLAVRMSQRGHDWLAEKFSPMIRAEDKLCKLFSDQIPGEYPKPFIAYIRDGQGRLKFYAAFFAQTAIRPNFPVHFVTENLAVIRDVNEETTIEIRPGQMPLLTCQTPYEIPRWDQSIGVSVPFESKYIMNISSERSTELSAYDLSDYPTHFLPPTWNTLRLLSKNDLI